MNGWAGWEDWREDKGKVRGVGAPGSAMTRGDGSGGEGWYYVWCREHVCVCPSVQTEKLAFFLQLLSFKLNII